MGKRIEHMADVIGREFPYGILSAIVPFVKEQLLKGLDELMESEILYVSGSAPAATYSFKHSLLHEAAYQTLLRSKRKLYHGQIAQAYLKDVPQIILPHLELKTPHLNTSHQIRPYLDFLLKDLQISLRDLDRKITRLN